MSDHGPVEFGLFTHVEKSSGSAALDALYEEHLAFLAEAEAARFWGFHLAEHHSTPLSTTPSPGMFLAAASQRTKRMRLGAMVFLLPFYQVLRLANEISMLDNLTNGRLEVGVGRGISPFEHAYFGNPILESHEMFADALDALVKGLTQDRLSHQGAYYRYHDVPMVVRPKQAPYPGLWYGIINAQSAHYAARHRMNVLSLGPTEHALHALEAWHEAMARPAAERAYNAHVRAPRFGVTRWIVLADTDKEAEALGRASYAQFMDNIQKLWLEWGTRDLRVGHDYETMVASGAMFVGSPAAVRDRLAQQIEKLPLNYVVLNMKWGNLSAAQSLRTLELFATKVRPELPRPARYVT
jgi:alkanesulfonate monooxygenase SsuD/methylene tetrahydromethanopterin reductase-like flavin-dependent oxidoreductase (luciferase family)